MMCLWAFQCCVTSFAIVVFVRMVVVGEVFFRAITELGNAKWRVGRGRSRGGLLVVILLTGGLLHDARMTSITISTIEERYFVFIVCREHQTSNATECSRAYKATVGTSTRKVRAEDSRHIDVSPRSITSPVSLLFIW